MWRQSSSCLDMYIFVQRQEFSLQASPLPNPFKIYCWRFVRRNAVSKAVVWFDFFFSHLYFWLLESDVPRTLCSVTFFFFLKHLIPFLIETRQEESLRWEKTDLKWILSTWDVFQLWIWGWPVPLTSKNFPESYVWLLQAQEWFICLCRKSSKSCRKHAVVNMELLIELRCRKKEYRWWKQGQIT